jgi:hypothetical protein
MTRWSAVGPKLSSVCGGRGGAVYPTVVHHVVGVTGDAVNNTSADVAYFVPVKSVDRHEHTARGDLWVGGGALQSQRRPAATFPPIACREARSAHSLVPADGLPASRADTGMPASPERPAGSHGLPARPAGRCRGKRRREVQPTLLTPV